MVGLMAGRIRKSVHCGVSARVRWIGALTAVLAVVVPTAVSVPAQAATHHGASYGAAPAKERSIPVSAVKLGRAPRHVVKDQAVSSASLPAEGTASVSLPLAPAVGGAGKTSAVRAGKLPVWFAPGRTSPPKRSKSAGSSPSNASSTTAAAIRVAVAPQSTSRRLGLHGVVVSAQRTDHAGDARRAQLTLDYGTFRNAFGAGWGSRLRLIQLPACALTTPQKAACRTQTPIASTNRDQAHQLTASLSLAPAASAPAQPMVLAAQATPSGDGGSFAATSLTPDGQWSAGSGSGAFTWSYGIGLPQAPGGLEPQVGLSYNSQAVDGRTSATSPQASWVGDGWSDTSSFIERDFIPCSQDSNSTDNTPKTGDLCWSDSANTLTMSLNGSSTTLVHDDKTGAWKAQNDTGEQISLKTDTVNADHAHQYWVVTVGTTSYYFGLNQLPGYAAGDATTDSVWTTPVYGNDAGEPCHASTFAASSCSTAYRWNLDYVVDSHQDAISYWYKSATGYYGPDNTTTPTAYTRDGWLDHIDYGQRDGHVYDTAQPAAAQVSFDVSERCDPSGGFDCSQALSSSTAAHWPDVPYDLNCASSGTCDIHGPSFWSTKELTGIHTQVLVGSAYSKVDSWALAYDFPATGDASPPSLWLSSITRTGQDGGTASLPPITFTPRMMANRVPSLAGYQPYTRPRLYQITTESGSVIAVNYTGSTATIPACDNRVGTSVVLPSSPDANGWLCYPAYWTPPGQTAPQLDWFNKYVVDSVTQQDPITHGKSTTTAYSYIGTGAWHYDDNPATQTKYRTWDQWRGFGEVDTRTGLSPDPVTLNKAIFFRGMDGDKTSSGTRSVTLNDQAGDDPQKDADALAGATYETLSYNGDGGALLADTVNDPWLGPLTASQDRSAVGLDPLTARMSGTSRTRTTTTKADGTARTTETDYTYDDTSGLVTSVNDLGDTSTASDDQCSRVTFAKNGSGQLLDVVSRITAVSVACDKTPSYPKDAVSDTQIYYDGSSTPGTITGAGDVTRVDEADSVAADGTPHYVTAEQETFDQYGRPLTSTDGDNRTTTTAYTPATGANPTQIAVTDPKLANQSTGFTTYQTYDPARALVTKTLDPAGYSTTSAYDPLGRLTAVWDPGFSQSANPDQPNTKYSYQLSATAPSTVTTQTLTQVANGTATYRTSISLYDALLRQVETQSATVDGGRDVTDTVYDSHGWAVKSDDAYYNSGAPSGTLVQAPDNQVPASQGTVYDGSGRPTAQISYKAATETWRTTTAYPGSDETVVTPPAGATKTATFTDARGHTSKLLQYDPAHPDSPDAVTYTYDARGDQLTQSDSATATLPQHTWTNTYDLLGRKTSSTDPDTGTTTQTFDHAGQLLTTTDQRGKQISYTYDAMGRKTAAYDTTSTSAETSANELDSWAYDTLKKGLPTSSTSYQNGNAYTEKVLGYDSHGWSQGSQTVIPAAEGALAGTYSTQNTYDYTGTLHSYLDTAAGSLPQETVTYTYDAFGNPTHVASGTGGWDYLDKVDYNEFEQPTRLTYGPSTDFTQQTLSWDEQTKRLTESQTVTGSGATTADDTSYSYGDKNVSPGAGLITSISDKQDGGATTDTQCFAYDHLQRLSSAWTATDACAATPSPGSSSTVGGPSPYWQSWTYDQQGNRLTQTDHDTSGDTTKDTLSTYTPIGGSGDAATPGKPAHGLDSVTTGTALAPSADGTTTYTYDAAGNTTSRTDRAGTDTLTYDTQGRLASLASTGTSSTTTYTYDADGNLLLRHDGSNTTLFLGDEEITLAQGQSTPSGVRYISIGGSPVAVHASTGDVSYLIPNQQGTDQLQIDATTQAVTRRSYTPFGQTRTTTSDWLGDKGFVGGQQDDTTGLTNLGAREYDPTTGRFLSPDPLIDSGDPQQWNAYTYADNSPVAKSDPTGTMACRSPDECAGGTQIGDNSPSHQGKSTVDPSSGCSGCDGRPDHDSPPTKPANTVSSATSADQAAKAQAAAAAREAAAADAQAAAAKAREQGLTHRILSLIADLVGITDAVNCVTKGSVMGCINTALNFIPWGKIFKAGKIIHEGEEAYDVWRAVEKADDALRDAEALSRDAHAAEDAAKAEAEAADAQLAAVKDQAAKDESAGAQDGTTCTHSFTADTRVLLADGTTKRIKDLKTGDKVLATDPQTNTTQPQTVQHHIITTTDHDFTQLTLATTSKGPRGPTTTLTTTWHHPFWNATTHQWTNASQLTPGTKLRQPNGTTLTVTRVRNNHAQATTYDLTVAELHTYYVVAGDTPVLVHNCGTGTADSLADSLTGDTHFHYTNEEGYNAIMRGDGGAHIAANPAGKVHVTQEIYSPAEAEQNLFIGAASHSGRGDYVIAFNRPQGAEFVPGAQSNELIHWGSLKISSEDILFAGRNPFGG
ncbi:RHS repeat-associated core domain-containing protein [Phaeacidiphilus oryzae]|uniref:RHS repeat-associated core domain-containing protein n=1 Tax=Phaeacidiphilus oryzae TaxID=348818 RepID=UPI000690A188|nr:RHS repeat-associated core domain-containing protein [Phaeacidiphilus oryzae]